MSRNDHTDPCPHDHQRLLEDLRRMPSRNIGRLLQPALTRVLDGEPQAGDEEALRVGGSVLADRKRGRKAA